MASMYPENNGFTIQAKGPDGKRRPVRLGKVGDRRVQEIKGHVDELEYAICNGLEPVAATRLWVNKLDDKLRNRLAKAKLCTARERLTLKAFLDRYLKQRTDLKPGTIKHLEHTKRNLVDYFGPDRLLRSITPGDADDWRRWLADNPLPRPKRKKRADSAKPKTKQRKLSPATVNKRSGNAKQFFNAALRKGLVDVNPFADLSGGVSANPERFYFVSREETEAVLDACPDAQWRCLFALARYGGLRCPSEVLRLRWQDIDWARNRFTVHSSKTEHHAGKATRVVPLFPGLLPFLRAAFEEAEEGAEHVITRYRDSAVNLRTQLKRIIANAGLEPWPKLWQNLRSTRETELAEKFPIHVVCQWIGNSAMIAAKHYLQVTDDHFEQAATEVVQNLVQQDTADDRTESPVDMKRCTSTHENALVHQEVGEVGFEPT